jgi:hypothetical protein
MSNLAPQLATDARELDGTAHAWAERRVRHPDDDLIRRAGFEIYSRPRRGPVLWIRRGAVAPMVESAALEVAWEKERQSVEQP